MRRAIAVGALLLAAACSNDAGGPATTLPPSTLNLTATSTPTLATAPRPPLPSEAPPLYDVAVSPRDDLAALVADSPEGTAFLLAAGVHRIDEIVPKDGMAFYGEQGSVVSGARVLTDWVEEDGRWVIGGQTQEGETNGRCVDDYEGCVFPEDLFIDDTMLWQVTSRDELTTGTWFFDYDNDRIEMFDDPTGGTVEISVTRSAFSGDASDVTITGLVIEKFASPAQRGAVHGKDGNANSTGWQVTNNEIRLNHGVGVRVADEGVISGNYIHHNGQLGLGATGKGALVEGNEIAFNNIAGFASGFSGGGSKFTNSQDLIVRNNYSHHNNGPGLWTDINNVDTLYENNTVAHNTGAGIFHEISYAAVIRGNTAFNNGDRRADGTHRGLWGAGILISASADVEVVNNTVINNQNGITGVQQDRGSGQLGPYELRNLWVHDNTIVADLGRAAGVGANASGQDQVFDQNNRFDSNTYMLSGDAAFAWGGARDWSEWQALGHDVNGTLLSN